ncbi:cytochrome P450 [Phanerochaete sordida]|uniref:Cytochrome P450 n=1 Tax=Phanerochaete sordida TaxID=48140 RepID=A0A9P3FXS8_9APHY|nr:cytochrome P450 [Phanerochaete sordida]
MMWSTTAHILAPSLAGCAYFYYCDPRGHLVLIATLSTYSILAVQDYLALGSIPHAAYHALLAVAAQMLLVTLAVVAYRLSPLHPLWKFPGPMLERITSLRMAYFANTGRRTPYVAELHEKYGTFVRIGPNKLSIKSVDAIHPIYASAQAFDKAISYRMGLIQNNSLFFLRDKPAHGRSKRVWSGALTNHAINQWDGPMENRTTQLIDCMARRQDSSGVVDLSTCFQHWSFDFDGDWALGEGQHDSIEFMRDGDPAGVVESGEQAILMLETFGEVPALFDIISSLPINDGYLKLEKLAHKELRKRLKTDTQNGWDLFSFLMAQRDDYTQAPMNETDLHTSAVLAFDAGGDTTAGFLSLTMFHLLHNRSSYIKLRQELDDTFPSGELTAEQHAALADLPYLGAVVNEGLRVGAAFPGFPRVVPPGGALLAGQFVPGGTIVGVPSFAVHTDPANFWPEPCAFRPERWFEDGLGPGTVTRREAFMAFQFGPFRCVGKGLALREMHVVLSRLLLAYDLEFAPDFDPEAFLKGWSNTRTNVIRYHLRVQAKRRQR